MHRGSPSARERITANFDHELQLIRGIEHSAWAAFNAVSQWVDWERPSRRGDGRTGDERRFQSALLGAGAELKRKAFALALSMTTGGRLCAGAAVAAEAVAVAHRAP